MKLKYLFALTISNFLLAQSFGGILAPIVSFKLKEARKDYVFVVEVFRGLEAGMKVLHKNKEVGSCKYGVNYASFQRSSVVPMAYLDLELKECDFKGKSHEENIALAKKAALRITSGKNKGLMVNFLGFSKLDTQKLALKKGVKIDSLEKEIDKYNQDIIEASKE